MRGKREDAPRGSDSREPPTGGNGEGHLQEEAAQRVKQWLTRNRIAVTSMAMVLVASFATMAWVIIAVGDANKKQLECLTGINTTCAERQEKLIEDLVSRIVSRQTAETERLLREHDRRTADAHRNQKFVIVEEGDTIVVRPSPGRSSSPRSPSPVPSHSHPPPPCNPGPKPVCF